MAAAHTQHRQKFGLPRHKKSCRNITKNEYDMLTTAGKALLAVLMVYRHQPYSLSL